MVTVTVTVMVMDRTIMEESLDIDMAADIVENMVMVDAAVDGRKPRSRLLPRIPNRR